MSETLDDALGEVRPLLRPDGGDLELLGLDDATGTVRLRLLLDDASCGECVLPRPILVDVVRHALDRRGADIAAVLIDDPRET